MTEAPSAHTANHSRRWLILSHAFNVDGRAESVTITVAAAVQRILKAVGHE